MGLEDVQFYKRMLDELARPSPDLAYKFKSAAEVAKPADTPNVVMSGSPAAPVDIAYTDKTEIPGRPTFPFEVRVMADEEGTLTSIRCYKGKIYDPRTGQMASSFKGLLVQGVTSRKRVTLSGNRGNVSGDQKDFTPSNYAPGGPEQFKYAEYNDPIQTTWLPNYEGLSSSGVSNTGKDSDPIETTVTFATGSYPIAKDSYTTADDGAYFEWPYVNGAMVRLFCYDDGDPATRKWGIWGNSGLPESVGSQGFFIFLAQINGSQVMQMFRSDIVALGGGGVAKRPFMLTSDGNKVTIEAGSANGIVCNGISNYPLTTAITLYWNLHTQWSGNSMSGAYASFGSSPANTQSDSVLAMPVGMIVSNGTNVTVSSYLSGSVWAERMKCGNNPAEYYVGTV